MAAPAAGAEVKLVDMGHDPDGVIWRIVNDTVMGGRSRSTHRVADGALHFSGRLNTDGGGFASVRARVGRNTNDMYDSIRLGVNGDGRSYQVRLISASTRTAYRAVFSTGPDVNGKIDIPLEAFQATWRGRLLDRPPIRASDIAEVGILLADGKDGPFSIRIASISLVRSGR
jgi:monofunctional biosynthetic peptidoglycan transglycosylase